MDALPVITRKGRGRINLESRIPGAVIFIMLWGLAVICSPQTAGETAGAISGGISAESSPVPAPTLSKDSEIYRETREVLPPRFYTLETRRFVVFSDTDSGWTRAQADRLERAHHQFMRFTRRLSLEPYPLRHKLVCVLFDRREDYQAFARQHDEVADPWIAGYYSPRHDRIVFYNIKSNPSVARARSKLAEMRDRVEAVTRDAEAASRRGDGEIAQSLLELNEQYRKHIDLELERVEEFTERVSVATTIHEAIHMLCFHTRIQSPRVQYPLWICEGLATAFETEEAGQAFGPDFEYAPRRERFAELLAQGGLLEMEQLVAITGTTMSDEETDLVYHQSYALITWMQRFRRPELAKYLRLMFAERRGPISAERHRELFESAFGDLARLQQTWLRHEESRSDNQVIVQAGS